MSKNLQNFIRKQFIHKITELQQLGGSIEWSDSSVIISGASQSVLNDFDNNVLCTMEEETHTLVTKQWNKVLHVNLEDDTSILSQLKEEFTNKVKIDLDYEDKSITFVGEEEMVQKVRHKLFNELCQELPMLG